MVQDWAGLLLATVGELFGPSEEVLLPASIHGQPRTRYKKPPLFGRVGKTAHRGAARHPSLIPGNEIESRSQLLGEQPRPPRTSAQPVNAGLTGTAKIDEQRSDSVLRIGRGQFDDRKVNLLIA